MERAKLSPSIGIWATPAISFGGADADQIEQGRRQVAGVDELMAHLAPGRDFLRPGHDEGIADAAAMGVLLVAAQRRVRRHRPAMRKIAVRVRPADVVDPAQLFRHRLGTEIIRPHRVDESERPALLAGAIVGQHQDQRVVADAGLVEKRDQPRQMLVGMVEHAGERRLQPREHAPFVGTVLVPRLHAVIARAAFWFPAARSPSPSAAPSAARARRPSHGRTSRHSS